MACTIIGVLLVAILVIAVHSSRFVLNIVGTAGWPLSVAGAVHVVGSQEFRLVALSLRIIFET